MTEVRESGGKRRDRQGECGHCQPPADSPLPRLELGQCEIARGEPAIRGDRSLARHGIVVDGSLEQAAFDRDALERVLGLGESASRAHRKIVVDECELGADEVQDGGCHDGFIGWNTRGLKSGAREPSVSPQLLESGA